MRRLFTRHSTLAAAIAAHGPAYAAAIEPAILERTTDGVWFDASHPAYKRKPAKPDTTPDPQPWWVKILADVPWPKRGALLWMVLRNHRSPSQALIDQVTPLLVDGGCACRSHWRVYLKASPPAFGDGWVRWVFDAQNSVNGRRRGVSQMSWDEAERRRVIAGSVAQPYVITLERTPGRLIEFYRDLPSDWPYPLPEPFYGIDGHAAKKPPTFTGGKGSYGCQQSWLGLLDRYIASEESRPIPAMEDDNLWTGPMSRLAEFVQGVPADADLASPGAQRLRGTDREITPGVDRAGGLHRTHCLLVYPQYAKPLRDAWAKYHTDIDHYLTEQSLHRKFYVANPLLCRQRAGFSEITSSPTDHRNWQGHTPITPDDRHERYGVDVPLKCGGVKRFVNVGERNAFNGASIVTPRGRFMVYRADDGYTLRWLYLTPELTADGSLPRGSFDLTRNDDPRLFFHAGELYLLTDYWWGRWAGSQMELRRVTFDDRGEPKLTDVAKWTEKSPPLWPGYKKPAFEKNWVPFSHTDGELYLIHSVQPHRVIRVDLAKGGGVVEHAAAAASVPWPVLGDVRLSAPPVRLADGSYLSTLHTRLVKDYTVGFYRFSGEALFDVLEMSREPVLWPDDSDDVCWRNGNMRLLFVQSMEIEGDSVVLWGGDNDHSVVRLVVPLATVMESMVAV